MQTNGSRIEGAASTAGAPALTQVRPRMALDTNHANLDRPTLVNVSVQLLVKPDKVTVNGRRRSQRNSQERRLALVANIKRNARFLQRIRSKATGQERSANGLGQFGNDRVKARRQSVAGSGRS